MITIFNMIPESLQMYLQPLELPGMEVKEKKKEKRKPTTGKAMTCSENPAVALQPIEPPILVEEKKKAEKKKKRKKKPKGEKATSQEKSTIDLQTLEPTISVGEEKTTEKKKKKNKKRNAAKKQTTEETTNSPNPSDSQAAQPTKQKKKRNRRRKGRARLGYHNGQDRYFGKFHCNSCDTNWTSSHVYTFAGTKKVKYRQKCKKCTGDDAWIFPFDLDLIHCRVCEVPAIQCICQCEDCEKLKYRPRGKDSILNEDNYCKCDKRNSKKKGLGDKIDAKKRHIRDLCEGCKNGIPCSLG